jgi:hypothetical protein
LLTQAKNNVSALELTRHLGVRYKTAWLLKHKLMQVMCEREAPRQLDGRVEIDDAYLGGELPGGKSGRGSENKVSFVAAVQTTDTGRPLRVCLKKLEFTKEAIAEWAKTALAASARVVSDGYSAQLRLELVYKHINNDTCFMLLHIHSETRNWPCDRLSYILPLRIAS